MKKIGSAFKTPSDTLSGILLALAGIAISWSSFQAATWDGITIESFNRASSMQLQSALSEAEAKQQQMLDINVFMQWMDAYARRETDVHNFYEERFRPEFKPAFDAWIASRPRLNPEAQPTPFTQPEYKLALQEKSRALKRQANETFHNGQEAGTTSDNYMRNTVIFGLVLFFTGISQQFTDKSVKSALLFLSTILTGIGFFFLAAYPVAPG